MRAELTRVLAYVFPASGNGCWPSHASSVVIGLIALLSGGGHHIFICIFDTLFSVLKPDFNEQTFTDNRRLSKILTGNPQTSNFF